MNFASFSIYRTFPISLFVSEISKTHRLFTHMFRLRNLIQNKKDAPRTSYRIQLVGITRFELAIFCTLNRRGNQAALYPEVMKLYSKTHSKRTAIKKMRGLGASSFC